MIPGVVAMQQLFRSHPFDVGCPHARHKHSAKVLPPGRCVILSSAREAWGVPMILNRREGTGVGITQPEGMREGTKYVLGLPWSSAMHRLRPISKAQPEKAEP